MMMDRGWSGECQERQRKQHRNAEVAEQLAIGHCKLQLVSHAGRYAHLIGWTQLLLKSSVYYGHEMDPLARFTTDR